MYSIHNEEKSVVAERFIITLKTKIYKFVTSISKNVNINRFDDIVSEYDNTYHIKIKIKSVDVKDNTYIDSIELHSMELRSNDKDTEFKVSDNVRISKYKNIFAKGYTPNWPEKYFVIKKVKNTVSWTYVINDLNDEEITETIYEEELQKTKQQEYRIVKVIERKADKLYPK